MQSQDNSFVIPQERKNTDRSPEIERTHTGESRQDEREAQEHRLDAPISTHRVADDAERPIPPCKEDAALAWEWVDAEIGASNGMTSADEQIPRERQRANCAARTDRTRTDASLSVERSNRRFREKDLLDDERRETDRNLAHEREQTDISIQSASKSLTDEQTSHAKTRSDLTTRDEFLAIVSHDLRNPIGAISACASILLENHLDGVINKETRTWIEFIKRNADNALRLTSDLLDIERMSTGKLELEPGQHDIAKLIRQAAEQFVSMAAAKSILIHPIPHHVSEIIACDSDRILQVLSNLIGNAVKFTSEHGVITINLMVPGNGDVEVSIRDTGPGIPDDKKGTIFERFSQLNNKDRRGLGLGLYISKQIIEAHRGRLWVESRVGEGSKFTFTLPKRLAIN